MREQARGRKARAAILAFVAGKEPAPTVRQIATGIGLSVAATHRHIRILVDRDELRET